MAAAAETEPQFVRFDWEATLREQFQGERFQQEAQRLVNEANTLEGVIHDQRQKIDNNADLSPQGRNNSLARMRESLRPRVQQFADKAQEFRDIRKRERAKRIEPEPEGDPATIASRAREIRDQLRGMEQGDVLRVLQQAGRDGDIETVRAIEGAPKVAPLADPEAIERVREERLAETFPEATQRLSDQSELIDLLDNMALHLSRRLEA